MRALNLLLLLISPACIASAFGPAMAGIGVDSWIWIIIFSLAGGVVSLLQKVPAPGTVPGNLMGHVARDLCASLVAGVLVFFMAESRQMDPMLTALFITLGSWGGAATIQLLYRRMFPPNNNDNPTKE